LVFFDEALPVCEDYDFWLRVSARFPIFFINDHTSIFNCRKLCCQFREGISLLGSESSGNIISGNYVGTDITGTCALGNLDMGVGLELGANNNLVSGNLIVTTGRFGVVISDSGSSAWTRVTRLLQCSDNKDPGKGDPTDGDIIGWMNRGLDWKD
jgi:hypothetical protein